MHRSSPIVDGRVRPSRERSSRLASSVYSTPVGVARLDGLREALIGHRAFVSAQP